LQDNKYRKLGRYYENVEMVKSYGLMGLQVIVDYISGLFIYSSKEVQSDDCCWWLPCAVWMRSVPACKPFGNTVEYNTGIIVNLCNVLF